MIQWDLHWSPEGRRIARVTARTAGEARRKAPKPYREYLGEIGAYPVITAMIKYDPSIVKI